MLMRLAEHYVRLITLITAAVGYLLADRVIGWLAQVAEVAVPVEIQPIVIALMLGIITDYSILFISAARGGGCRPARPTLRPLGRPSASICLLCLPLE